MEPFQNETRNAVAAPVLFGVESVGSVGIATVELNRPAILNALDTDCYKLLESRLIEWQNDSTVGAIIISGKGGKAFCAGGDVKGLVLKSKEFGLKIALEFFTHEYFVDGFVHNYRKPIVAICDGITMGGGLGLAAGAILRIATERTLVAMPELSIGLFPDVGATRFLGDVNMPGFESRRVRAPFGLFMGLTGARLSGADAVRIGLMDAFVPTTRLRHLHVDLLRAMNVDEGTDSRELAVTANVKAVVAKNSQKATSGITETDEHIIEDIFSLDDLLKIDRRFKEVRKLSPWLEETRTRYLKGSPLSRRVFFEAFHRHRNLSIIETLTREWEMSICFSKGSEFAEGVRAVLIEKDHAPKWRYSALDQIPGEVIESMFRSGEPENLLVEKFREFGF